MQMTLQTAALLLLLARSGGAQAPLAPKVCEGYNLTIVRRPLGMSLGAAAANTFVKLFVHTVNTQQDSIITCVVQEDTILSFSSSASASITTTFAADGAGALSITTLVKPSESFDSPARQFVGTLIGIQDRNNSVYRRDGHVVCFNAEAFDEETTTVSLSGDEC